MQICLRKRYTFNIQVPLRFFFHFFVNSYFNNNNLNTCVFLQMKRGKRVRNPSQKKDQYQTWSDILLEEIIFLQYYDFVSHRFVVLNFAEFITTTKPCKFNQLTRYVQNISAKLLAKCIVSIINQSQIPTISYCSQLTTKLINHDRDNLVIFVVV